MNVSDRLAAFHQYAIPLSMLFMSIGLNVVLWFAGLAMLRGTLEAASFVAVATGFFGLMGGALGVTSQRGSQRASDQNGGGGGSPNASASVTVVPPAG